MTVLFTAAVNATIFSLLGVVVFALSFWLLDRLTPYNLWRDLIEKQNTAVAILAGSIAIAIGLIVSAAIHG
jgi:uncharacterized membrane protein YjfL (UPF0719 family)